MAEPACPPCQPHRSGPEVLGFRKVFRRESHDSSAPRRSNLFQPSEQSVDSLPPPPLMVSGKNNCVSERAAASTDSAQTNDLPPAQPQGPPSFNRTRRDALKDVPENTRHDRLKMDATLHVARTSKSNLTQSINHQPFNTGKESDQQ